MLGREGNGDGGGEGRVGKGGANSCRSKTERSAGEEQKPLGGEEQKPLGSAPESSFSAERQTTASSWLKGILSSPAVFATPISTSSLFMPLARGSGGGAEAEGSGGGCVPRRGGEEVDRGTAESLTARRASVGRGVEEEGAYRQGAGRDDVRYSRAPPSPRHVRGPSPPPSTLSTLDCSLRCVSGAPSTNDTGSHAGKPEDADEANGEEEKEEEEEEEEEDHEVWC